MGPSNDLRKTVSPEAYHVLYEKGTEPPFSGKYYYNKERGTYHCAGCGNVLFDSATQYESGTGWPSFYGAVPGALTMARDRSLGMVRTEVKCARCGGHLGHWFDDGPAPTGERFCINSAALDFKKS
ncbi:peptide-methionine (R)-S-oxide reductase [Hydrogenispora ethanolica]|jgi:peptide-methionine (R)-S-oxide reductase|uniref:peptide-methionine (R)-S-oxide reductase n=1 Tax=Hydrogenispora ethanolica TaxID=1082276 RepID=A0A4R1R9L6_HYDET|nr:peptide-methionine (R)-S-oxide reductase MsrB [Hydrogenispora ethanolica]TCL62414.1 peptide-methionine (R)-S-oxide reductase [Hydrogenispora ethanolica]